MESGQNYCFIQVWVDGASQAMYTFGVCFLALTTFGSYNKKKNDFFK